MVPRTPQKRSVERRAALLDAARTLLNAEGTRAVTHRRVAERAGVPTASVGYYFASREELLLDCLRADEEDRIRTAQALREDASPALPPREVGERAVLTIWADRTPALVGRVWAAMDGVREGPLLRAQAHHGRLRLDANLAALLSACGYPADLAGFVLTAANGSIVNSGVEGRAEEAFARASEDVAVLLDRLGRSSTG